MAGNFLKAINEAHLSVTTSHSGSRVVNDGAAMDKEGSRSSFNQYSNRGDNFRGRFRGRSRGRGADRGGRYNSGKYGNRGRYNNRNDTRGYAGINPRSKFESDEDGDESMQEKSHSTHRYNPYGGRRNFTRGYGRDRQSNNKQMFDSGWFKISVPGGKNHEKNWLTSKLKSLVDDPFEIVEFHYMGDTACFFVDDKNVADGLKRKSHRITCHDGSKIVIHVRESYPPRNIQKTNEQIQPSPSAPLDAETKQILMNCLAQRFKSELNSVDLSNLIGDSVLNANGIQGNVNKPWLMSGFLDIINTICPQLKGLDLSNNRIRNLDIIRDLPDKLAQLEILSLQNNEIQNIEELEKIKNAISLKHLLIKDNPICLKYQNMMESLRMDVRSKLPKLELLDDVQLPPPILFDVPSSVSLPTSKEYYVPNSQVQGKIIQFIQQYYRHYDSDDRQGLLDFYHEQAVFSMCINTNVRDFTKERPEPLNLYFPFSRNQKRLRDKAKRLSLLKNTKLSTVAFLTELPKTKHDLQSFALDVSVDMSTFLCFSVRGNFLEGEARDTLRSFSRQFIVSVSAEKGMKIVNDQLHIRNPYGSPTKAVNVAAPAATSTASSSNQHQELIKRFSEASKMNLTFSKQCLEQNDWNFEKAGQVFTNLQREGKIPAEAFVS